MENKCDVIEQAPKKKEFDARQIYQHPRTTTEVVDKVYAVMYGFSSEYDRPPVDGGFHSLARIFHRQEDAAVWLDGICAEFHYDPYLKEFVWCSDSPYESDIVMRFVVREYDVY